MDHIDELYNDLISTPTENGVDPLDLGLDNIEEDGDANPVVIEVENPDVLQPEETKQDNDNDFMRDYLNQKGINPDSIMIENEDGNNEEVAFDNLSNEEKLNLIESISTTDITDELDDHEIDVVNFLRENEMSFEDAVEYFKKQGVKEFIEEQQARGFEVDSFTDEEIYALDLKSKFEDLTDEELELELEKQLENPELFKKKVEKIREDFKEANKLDIESAEQERAEQEQQLLGELQENLVNVATSISDIGGLEIDDDEKEEVLSLILDRDINNASKLLKHLDDPETLFKVSWFVLYGEEAFETIHNYWKSEIEKNGNRKQPLQDAKGSSVKKENIIPTPNNNTHFGKKGKATSVDELWQ